MDTDMTPHLFEEQHRLVQHVVESVYIRRTVAVRERERAGAKLR